MKKLLVLAFAITFLPSYAQKLVYDKADSLKVVQLLAAAPVGKTTSDYVHHFGSALAGVPYVAKTLDRSKRENLVVNLRELDCTTFTETSLALALCMSRNEKTFAAFSKYLRLLRYERGHISYDKRQHYFTTWIDAALRNSFVTEPEYPAALSPRKKTLDINYMTTHTAFYPQLASSPALTDSIRQTERRLTGRTFSYIPKASLSNYTLLRQTISNGDIIVIITSKAGLDTSHIGIASWHKDGTLHLLNASQIHHRVIDEPLTLKAYMQRHPSQQGIRVLHCQ